ncbi:pyridoxal phosphate phosphatase [Diretmus argenteus]
MAGMATSTRGCCKIRGSGIRELLDNKHTVLFDCDGVIWNGDAAVRGAPEAVSLLKRHGKKVYFVTNNCTRPRATYATKFSRLGFTDVAEEEIFSSAYCSAAYLRDAELQEGGKVFVIGCQGLMEELREAGVPVVVEESDQRAGNIYDYPLDPDVRAVLVGYDDQFTFSKLAKACCYLQNPACLFLATDPDPWHPLRGGRITPGSGSLTAAVETASSRTATVIGKPSCFMFECIASQFGLDPARSLMVGDRLETDILFGAKCGLDTLLTLTGVSTMEEAQEHKDSQDPERKNLVPDYVIDTIADFIEAYKEEEEEQG